MQMTFLFLGSLILAFLRLSVTESLDEQIHEEGDFRSETSLEEFLDSCFSPPSLCYYLLLVPSIVVVFTGLCCSKWVGYMFFKHN